MPAETHLERSPLGPDEVLALIREQLAEILADMRVVPEHSCIRKRQRVCKLATRRDDFLHQVCSIRCIIQTQSVRMKKCLDSRFIVKLQPNFFE